MATQIEIPACRIKKIEILRSIVVIYICGTGGVFMKNIDIHGMTNMELIRGEIAEWYWQRTIFTAISMSRRTIPTGTPCAEQPFVSYPLPRRHDL